MDDLVSWITTVVILCSLPAGVGVSLDRLLRRQDRLALEDRLTRWWIAIERTSFGQLHRRLAARLGGFLDRATANRRSLVHTLLAGVLCSSALTFTVILSVSSVRGLRFPDPFLWVRLIGFNVLFDFATVIMTIQVLRLVARTPVFISIALLALDVLLALLCALGVLVIPSLLDGSYDSRLVTGFFEYLIPGFDRAGSLNILGFAYASTTLIPTACIVAALLFLIAGKCLLTTTQFFLERVTEPEDGRPAPVFTLTGSLFSIICLTLSTVVKLIQIIRE